MRVLAALLLLSLPGAALAQATVPGAPPSPAAKVAPAAGPARSDGKATSPAPSTAPPAKTDPAADQDAREAQARGLLDLNSASQEELQRLPGLDEGGARRIIAARPYAQKGALLTRKILPKAVYDKVKDRLVVITAQPAR